MPIPLLGKVARGAAGGVGLAQEAYYHNKEKKAASRSPSPQPPAPAFDEQGNPIDDPPAYEEIDNDEDDWIADEAQETLHNPDFDPSKDLATTLTTTASQGEGEEDAVDKVIRKFLAAHPTPSNLSPTPFLPGPVVIPQKRPDMRTRGFVRAYAPALANCNVPEKDFMDFLAGFDQEINKQNLFNAANAAVAISMLSYFAAASSPEFMIKFAALAVHISIETGRRLYINKKENKYLDEMNRVYFKPRGLYAMIMAYKPGTNDLSTPVTFDSSTATAVNKRDDVSHKSKTTDYRAASGKTKDNELPQVCPLTYPGLAKSSASEEQKDNAFKRAMAFTRDYYDRRSQVSFQAAHPDSGVPMQEHEFAGSYGDPRNFQQSGLLGVLTNNKVDPMGRRIQRRNQRRVADGRKPRGTGQGGGGLVGRALGQGMLYVMVVNLPSDEELEEARRELEEIKAQKGNSWF